MDAVYVLGTGSQADNLELIYSVRSLAMHMLDLENVYVVGEKPRELPGIIHIPAKDICDVPWKNVYNKTAKACEDERISEEFLFMNDDFFMLEPFYGAEFPFFTIKNGNGGVDGMQSFHVHCPIRYKKEWYLNMPLDLNSKGTHSPRSFYGNFYRAPVSPTKDFVVRASANMLPYEAQVVGKLFFSIGDDIMLQEDFKFFLETLYKEPCRFERE